MAQDPITNSDIVRALNGEPSVERADYNQSVAESLNGRTPGQNKTNQSILEALNGGRAMDPVFDDTPRIGSGTLTESERSNKWLADLAMEAADSTLGAALMRKNPGMTAWDLSKKAQCILEECYAEGAKRSESEIERLEYAAEKAKRLASEMTGATTDSTLASTAQAQESKRAPKKDPLDIYVIVRGERVKLREAKLDGNTDWQEVRVYESMDGVELARFTGPSTRDVSESRQTSATSVRIHERGSVERLPE